MPSSSINFYNFYFRYLWSAIDFAEWQTGMVDSFRGASDAMTGGCVLTGLQPQRQSGTIIRILAGTALAPDGSLMVLAANFSCPTLTAKPSSPNAERALVVLRPKLISNTQITDPTNPTATVDLKTQQSCEVVVIRGVAAVSPVYPAKLTNDVILCGVRITSGNLDSVVDFDYSVRDIIGRMRPNQRGGDWSPYDDRLRPYRIDTGVVQLGIKPSVIGLMQSATTRDIPFQFTPILNSGKISRFPRSSFGSLNTTDTILNFLTGTITGGDEISPDFTLPVAPGGVTWLLGLVEIDSADLLYVKYAPLGTNNSMTQALGNIFDATDSFRLDPTVGRKIICYFVLSSSNGTTWTDIEVIDARNPGAVAIPPPITLTKIELTHDQSWVAPTGVTRVRLALYNMQFRHIAAKGPFALGIDITGAAYAWGTNTKGELGNGGVVSVSSPVLVSGAKTWKQISAGLNGGGVALGIDSLDDAYSWGDNSVFGSLGLGDLIARSVPVIIPGGRKWRSIYASVNGSGYGITTDGDGYAWGSNGSGELGIGSILNVSSPVLIVGGLKWKAFSPGVNFCIGITTDGTSYGWGSNTDGRAGIIGSASTPVAMIGNLKFREVCSGRVNSGYSYGITEDGTAYYWGEGGWGFGNSGGSTPSVAISAQESLKKWRMIRAGYRSIYGITTEGEAYSWGQNTNGQLGHNTVTSVTSIKLIVGSNKFTDIFASGETSTNDNADSAICLAGDGNIYSMGYGTQGQLGSGANTARSSPVAIVGGRLWNNIYDTQIAEVDVDVSPGTTYQLKVYPGLVSFAGVGVAITKVTPKVVLEYFPT